MTKIRKNELEKNLMENIRELSNIEQQEIKVYIAEIINLSEKIKKEKIQMLEKSIAQQIRFYGKKEDVYKKEIENIVKKYENLIQKVNDLYIVWFLAIISELQKIYDNQKISMTNCKLAIDIEDEIKKTASEYKINNYEIVIKECKKQLKDCKISMNYKINEMFCNKLNPLCERKNNIFEKIINIFVGKSKIKKFVIDSFNFEINKIEKEINNQTQAINEETVKNVAKVEDGIIQTEKVFKNMKGA